MEIYDIHFKNSIVNAIMEQATATQGDFLSPILAHFQHVFKMLKEKLLAENVYGEPKLNTDPVLLLSSTFGKNDFK